MNKRTKNGWAFYDWANSVYSLVISTAIFPIYYHSVTSTEDSSMVDFLGIPYENMAIYSYSLSLSFFIVALISPVLSGIADYTGNKKRFLQFFCYLGSASCASLFFFDGSNIYFGLGMSVLASIGFWGSLVFYNAFLPEIAKPEEQDALSAKGFSLGYIGAALLLIINLIMVMKPEMFGFTDSGQASRVSFLLVGIWWAGFAQITFRRLPNNPNKRKPKQRFIILGYKELGKVVHQLKGEKGLRRFLYSFFFYSMGVQTVILLASAFGDQELAMDSSKLILTILIIQFVAIGGSFMFAKISEKYGNIQAIKICIIIWALICLAAFTLSKADPMAEYKFYAIAAIVGMVLGGIQTISRSTYSKLIPKTKSHASFFSFYDVTEKIAIVLGTISYGWLIQITGSMKMSVLALMIFFIIGFLLITRVGRSKHVH